MADCLRCGGACCESVTLEVKAPTADFQRFIELRSLPQLMADGRIFRNFDARCHMLHEGRCVIYAQRPAMCVAFEPGGANCQATVRSRRTPAEADAILAEAQTSDQE